MRSYRAVVETGSFTAAGKRLDRTKAMISRQVNDLEVALSVRLINRTTRKLSVTEVGQAYYQECCRLLDDLEEVEQSLQQGHQQAKGLIRINAPQTFAELHLVDVINEFITLYPEVNVDLQLNDRFVDIVDEGFDMGIRIAKLGDSSLVARKLGDVRIMLCASPDYIKAYGMPETPMSLTQHKCVIDTNLQQKTVWSFANGENITINGALRANSAVAIRKAVMAGVGIGRCPSFAVEEDIAAGRLVPLLETYESEAHGLYAIYPHRKHLATKVRLMVDFLVKRFADQ